MLYEHVFHRLFDDRPFLSPGPLHPLALELIEARAVEGEQAIFYFAFDALSEESQP